MTGKSPVESQRHRWKFTASDWNQALLLIWEFTVSDWKLALTISLPIFAMTIWWVIRHGYPNLGLIALFLALAS